MAAANCDLAAYDICLNPYLLDRPFDRPTALAHLAQQHPDISKSHDRRITVLTGYYATTNDTSPANPPDLTLLRTSVDRDADPPRRLTPPRERAVFLAILGSWGPHRARYYYRDQLVGYLLLDKLRPAQVVTLDMRLMFEQPDGSWEVRIPDDHDAAGRQRVLAPLTGAAIKNYLPARPEPKPAVHELILGKDGRPVQSRYPNVMIRKIAATHPLPADRGLPVTADVIAHTGLWDEPAPELSQEDLPCHGSPAPALRSCCLPRRWPLPGAAARRLRPPRSRQRAGPRLTRSSALTLTVAR